MAVKLCAPTALTRLLVYLSSFANIVKKPSEKYSVSHHVEA
jgi:hypothetical protein